MIKESCAERPVLTQKEREVLNFIRDYWKKYQLYPSFREIGAGIGLRSASSVNRYIHSLKEYLLSGQRPRSLLRHYQRRE